MATSYNLLIINGLVVTASDIGHYDIAIKDEKIALLAPRGSLEDAKVERIIDAEGGWVMVCLGYLPFLVPFLPVTITFGLILLLPQPGGVDAHVHLEEPPLFGKGRSCDTYETGR